MANTINAMTTIQKDRPVNTAYLGERVKNPHHAAADSLTHPVHLGWSIQYLGPSHFARPAP